MNTFFNTLRNKKKNIPFLMWWFDVWIVATVTLIESIIRVASLSIIMPCWEMNIIAWVMKREIEYARKLNENKVH